MDKIEYYRQQTQATKHHLNLYIPSMRWLGMFDILEGDYSYCSCYSKLIRVIWLHFVTVIVDMTMHNASIVFLFRIPDQMKYVFKCINTGPVRV